MRIPAEIVKAASFIQDLLTAPTEAVYRDQMTYPKSDRVVLLNVGP